MIGAIMLKKLQTISWGGWSAVIALVLFLGLALLPVVAGDKSESGKPAKRDGLVAMIDKAAEKSAEAKGKHLEPKSAVLADDGTLYVGAKSGLFRVVEGKLEPVAGAPAADVKSLAAGPDGSLYLATKMGAYRFADGVAVSLYAGDTHSLSVAADGALHLVTKMEGVLASRDRGATWAPVALELGAAYAAAR